jgi:hypothetical protein
MNDEYVANRTVDGKDQAVRFVGVGKFAVLKDNVNVLIPEEFDQDPKDLFGEAFKYVAEFRTFYDTEIKKFRLVEYKEDEALPEAYVAIPFDGMEIDGWKIGRLEKKEVTEE